MMDAPFFSIIVPCCDAAPYIMEMADSLRSQSCGDFECLLIVEHSRDDTLILCRRLSLADRRFRLRVEPRSGSPATPRNTGLALARGEYVLLLDGDDWLAPEALAGVKLAIEEGNRPDVVQGAANEIYENRQGGRRFSRRLFNYRPEDDGRCFSGKEALICLTRLNENPSPAAWLSICRLAFLREHALGFIPGLRCGDEEWTPRVLYFASRLAVMNFAFYNRRKRAKSSSTKKRRRDLAHHAAVVKSLLDFYAAHPFSPALSRAWGRNLIDFFCYFFFHPKHAARYSPKRRRLLLRTVLADPASFRRLARHAPFSRRVAAFFVLLARRAPAAADLFFRFVYRPPAVGEEKRP